MNSTLNLQLHAISFFDNVPSNNPFLRHFDLTYKLLGVPVKSPEQRTYLIPPGSSEIIYDGTRTTAIGPATEFDITKPYVDKDIYRFTWNGTGPNPAFRTDRAIGITTATQFSITVNGPVATYSVSSGPFNTASVQVGDILLIQDGAGASAANQGRFSIIAVTSNSVSVQNLSAVAQTFTILNPDRFLIFSNGGSNNQAQIKDTLLIRGGFSPAIYGAYEIVEVAPEWIEVAVGIPNGFPLQNNIAPGANNFVIYKSLKKFVLLAAQQKVFVRFNDHSADDVLVEPVEANNPERPGVLLKYGSFYRLIIRNEGLHAAPVVVALAE